AKRWRQENSEQKGTKTTKGKGPPLHFLGFRPGLCFLLSSLPLRAGVIALDRNSLYWCYAEVRFERFSICGQHFVEEIPSKPLSGVSFLSFTAFPMRGNRLQKSPDRPNPIWPTSGSAI